MENFSPEDRLNEIWRQGREFGLMDSEIYHVLTTVVRERKEKDEKLVQESQISYSQNNGSEDFVSKLIGGIKVTIKFIVALILILLIFGIVISLHNPTRKFVTRNIQDFIYPVMTRLRRMSLPILAKYPKVISWYSEECILENPFFDHINLDCNICTENVKPDIVSSLENFSDVYYNNGKIVIINDVVKAVPWQELVKKIDIDKEEDMGSWKVSGKNSYSDNTKEKLMHEMFTNTRLHIEWKINRLETLHILREMLPRLYFIPLDTEISLHHSVFIDGPEHKAYPLPTSEFANVVLVQGDGSSALTLNPSPHCKDVCKSVTLTLNVSQALYFNWIFWRPVRISGEGISTLILSSFY